MKSMRDTKRYDVPFGAIRRDANWLDERNDETTHNKLTHNIKTHQNRVDNMRDLLARALVLSTNNITTTKIL